jgi:hypothetical protein
LDFRGVKKRHEEWGKKSSTITRFSEYNELLWTQYRKNFDFPQKYYHSCWEHQR